MTYKLSRRWRTSSGLSPYLHSELKLVSTNVLLQRYNHNVDSTGVYDVNVSYVCGLRRASWWPRNKSLMICYKGHCRTWSETMQTSLVPTQYTHATLHPFFIKRTSFWYHLCISLQITCAENQICPEFCRNSTLFLLPSRSSGKFR